MNKLTKVTFALLLIISAFIVGCSSEEATKTYTLKNQPHFNSLAVEFDKISKLGLSYDMNIKHLDEFLSIAQDIKKKLPNALEDKKATKSNSKIEDLDNNYSLFLKDTKMLVSEPSIDKIIILKNYLVVTDKIEDINQSLNGADNKKLIALEESLKTTWVETENNIKKLNNQNKDVKTSLAFIGNTIKDLDSDISAIKANKEPLKSLGAINNKAIDHIAGLKENIKRNQIVTITYLQGLIKTINSQWPNISAQ